MYGRVRQHVAARLARPRHARMQRLTCTDTMGRGRGKRNRSVRIVQCRDGSTLYSHRRHGITMPAASTKKAWTARNSARDPSHSANLPALPFACTAFFLSHSTHAGGALLRFLSGPLAVFACASLTARPGQSASLHEVSGGSFRLATTTSSQRARPTTPPPASTKSGARANGRYPSPPSLASIAHTCPAADERRGLQVSVLLLF
ncbi:hypothetical protein MRX96_002853 [Rhipicephalus microplus]